MLEFLKLEVFNCLLLFLCRCYFLDSWAFLNIGTNFTELSEDEDQFSFKIMFHGAGNRSYVLAAESQESMEQWMKALACSSYDYMKLMVADLQRQLDEMEGLCWLSPSHLTRLYWAQNNCSVESAWLAAPCLFKLLSHSCYKFSFTFNLNKSLEHTLCFLHYCQTNNH